jgi:4-hydroxy-tetrahydrodipicolinate synthase
VRAVAHAASLPVIALRRAGPCGDRHRRYDHRHAVRARPDLRAEGRDGRFVAAATPARGQGRRLLQFSGDDATAGAHRAMGGVGCVSVTANVVPAPCAALHRAWDAGDLLLAWHRVNVREAGGAAGAGS